MSVYLMGLVKKLRVGDPRNKAVLTWLCDLTHGDGGVCHESVPELVEATELGERTVQRRLRRLEEDGWITIETRPGRVNLYRINVRRIEIESTSRLRRKHARTPVKMTPPSPDGEPNPTGNKHPRQNDTPTPVKMTPPPPSSSDTPGGDTAVTPPHIRKDVEDVEKEAGVVTEGSVTAGADGAVSPPGFLSEFSKRERAFVRAAYEVCGGPLPDVWDRGLHLPEFNNARTALKLISEGDEAASLARIMAHKTVRTPRALLEIAAEGKVPRRSKEDKAAEYERKVRKASMRQMMKRREDDERRQAEWDAKTPEEKDASCARRRLVIDECKAKLGMRV